MAAAGNIRAPGAEAGLCYQMTPHRHLPRRSLMRARRWFRPSTISPSASTPWRPPPPIWPRRRSRAGWPRRRRSWPGSSTERRRGREWKLTVVIADLDHAPFGGALGHERHYNTAIVARLKRYYRAYLPVDVAAATRVGVTMSVELSSRCFSSSPRSVKSKARKPCFIFGRSNISL